ncbi:MAG: uncharacterized protein KVP18_002952 [Porospora cf. gigantea A]|uniref:uncharacterized protein n=2 Tax=Porospora cf. gigantea A TaxID=2853593 RepID=UPI00355AC1FE|nr:MAG: hypothetical protein KVP18_002952 [Porospora cf. gigantea A]
MSRTKIALVGAGQIGGTLALLVAQKRLGDAVLIDIMEGPAKAKALDLSQMGATEDLDCSLTGTSDYAELVGSDVVIITAGIPRKPGMSRDDLLAINTPIIQKIGEAIKIHCPESFVVCISNPVDVMVQILHASSGLPANKCVGMGGRLDSSRMEFFLAEKLGVSVSDVRTHILGGHGDLMVPLVRYTSVSGIPLSAWVEMGRISEQEIEDICQRTQSGGGEIVKLFGNGSAFYAPAAAAIQMVESHLQDRQRVLSCVAQLEGEYGISGVYCGVPVVIGKRGIESIVQLPLTEAEHAAFHKSVNNLKEVVKTAQGFMQ